MMKEDIIMKDMKNFEMEIEELRERLNLEIQNQMKKHVPSDKLLELSKKMDELLNEYHSEYYQTF